MKTKSLLFRWIAIFLLAVAQLGCDPAADHLLSAEEKEADMKWLYSIFSNNYAPLEYKEALFGFNFQELKKKYLTKAKRTRTNEEFYRVMAQFVAEFGDAHTGGSVTPNQLPGQAQVAYLGFTGVRDGINFRVTKILPTIDQHQFPIKINDVITKIDGIPVFEYIDRFLVPYRNLGHPLANKTAHMANLFTRMSLMLPMPEKDDVKLTVERPIMDPAEPPVRKIILPWIKKDLYDFKIEQAIYQASKNKSDALTVVDPATHKELKIEILDQRGMPIPLATLLDSYKAHKRAFLDSFELIVPTSIAFESTTPDDFAASKQEETGIKKLAKERNIPADAISIEEAKTFPAYIYSVPVKDKYQRVRGRKNVGYIRIDTFSPAGDPNQVVEQVRTTLRKFAANGVKNVVVDTIGNPGGSLDLAMKVAQAFSEKAIEMPEIQFGLNDNWLGALHSASLSGSDEQRVYAERLYRELRAQKNSGNRISKPYNLKALLSRPMEPNYGIKFDKIVVLTNEMNASCGDIFPAMMQDNELAIVAGENTMGAGGNVTGRMMDQSPNGHFKVRQTESLILRKDGSYIENYGVRPDIHFEVKPGYNHKYDNSRAVAEAIIRKKGLTPKLAAEVRRARAQAEKNAQAQSERESGEAGAAVGEQTAEERAARRAGGLSGEAGGESEEERRAREAAKRGGGAR
jgi:C-terminal processing protease CtpA/Prc